MTEARHAYSITTMRADPLPSKPQLSVFVACHDFASWNQSNDGKFADLSKLGLLLTASASAPARLLHQDLSTLESDVTRASKASGNPQRAKEEMTLTAVYTVERDCYSVNPGP